jgi:tRNA A-37 threonylcarbamoyl transferase component Bud32
MQKNISALAQSRTFRVVGGELSAADQTEQWSQVLNPTGQAQQAAIQPGQIVESKYRVIALIGAGGMGSVYRVQHLMLAKEMALKTISATSLTDDAWHRFQREARAIAKLTHVNIVQVYDFGIDADGVPYYTMELLKGQSLSQKIQDEGKLAKEEALPCFIQVAAALLHAHKHKIVHRDIKPANIFLKQTSDNKSVVKVVDFGIAKLATSQNIEEQAETDSGLVFGSPLYMSPEQSIGNPTDERTDIYSFGCSLFETLTGQPPFRGKNAFETITMHHHQMPPSLVEASGGVQFGQPLEKLVAKLLEKEAEDRYQSFEQVLSDLTRISASSRAAAGASAMAGARAGSRVLLAKARELQRIIIDPDDQEATGPFGFRNKRSFVLRVASILVILGAFGFGYKMFSAGLMRWSHDSLASVTPIFKLAHNTTVKGDAPAPDYFSTIEPSGSRVFNFPANTTFGAFRIESGKEIDASGQVTVPAGAWVELKAGEILQLDTSLFRRFRPDDITFLNCSSDLQTCWNTKHLDAITKYLTALRKLDITGARITSADIALLNRLKKLTELEVSDTALTGTDLTRLDRLMELQTLRMDRVKSLPAILAKVAASRHLKEISFDESNAGDAELRILSTIPQMSYISAEHDNITCAGLKYLTVLPLQHLSICGSDLGPEALPIFLRLKRLEYLRYSAAGWSKAQKDRLRQGLPGCKIIDKEDDSDVGKLVKGVLD